MMIKAANVVTIGKCCEILQAGPERVRAAAIAANVPVVLTINGRQHYAESDLQKIAKYLEASK
jgi:hypothetical protein